LGNLSFGSSEAEQGTGRLLSLNCRLFVGQVSQIDGNMDGVVVESGTHIPGLCLKGNYGAAIRNFESEEKPKMALPQLNNPQVLDSSTNRRRIEETCSTGTSGQQLKKADIDALTPLHQIEADRIALRKMFKAIADYGRQVRLHRQSVGRSLIQEIPDELAPEYKSQTVRRRKYRKSQAAT